MFVNKVSWEHNPTHSLVITVHGCVPARAAEIAEMESKGPYICSLALWENVTDPGSSASVYHHSLGSSNKLLLAGHLLRLVIDDFISSQEMYCNRRFILGQTEAPRC